MRNMFNLLILALSLCLLGCESTQNRPYFSDSEHLLPVRSEVPDPSLPNIPSIVEQDPVPLYAVPKTRSLPQVSKYTVVVTGVPVKELLFTLARDAKMNIDVADNIEGNVTLNAINQTLEEILSRISAQVAIRYSINNQLLSVAADTPYLKTYKVPYINMSRKSMGDVNASVKVGGKSLGQANDASSNLSVKNESENNFWVDLKSNIAAMVTGGEANVIMNPSTGYLTVRASQKQQKIIKAYIEKVVESARRQVLIEATIVEVTLSNEYEQGINWARIAQAGRTGLSLSNGFIPPELAAKNQQMVVSYLDKGEKADMGATIRLLQSFGNVKVLSSPKIMSLNNQTSVLKVVDNRVYFKVDVLTERSDNFTTTTYDTEINTVPEGFIMSLLPYIGDNDEVILNVRPTITRVLRYVDDPSPALASARVVSKVPEMQIREMETVLRLKNGQIAVLGGLMQDTANLTTAQLPDADKAGWFGNLFKSKEKTFKKSELVVFLRPVLVNNPDVDTDLSDYRKYLNPVMPERANP